MEREGKRVKGKKKEHTYRGEDTQRCRHNSRREKECKDKVFALGGAIALRRNNLRWDAENRFETHRPREFRQGCERRQRSVLRGRFADGIIPHRAAKQYCGAHKPAHVKSVTMGRWMRI